MGVARYIHKIVRYGLAALGILLLILVILTSSVYYIAVSDQDRVPDWVENYSREELGVEATFKHYRFQYFKHFPFLSLALEDVVVKTPDERNERKELLRVKAVDIVFRPWRLLQDRYELRSINIDTARVQLYRDPQGHFNADALQIDRSSMQADSSRFLNGLFRVNTFNINGLYVELLDSLHRKHHRFEVRSSKLQLHTSDTARHIGIQGNWLFHQLVFKMKNGPFFEQQGAEVDLQLALLKDNSRVVLHPSSIRLENDTLQLSGHYDTPEPGFLHLDIQADNLLLADAKPLLANNLQEALAPYQIDRPLRVQLTVEGATIPGKRQPLSLDISGQHLTLSTNSLRFSTPKLQAHYRNNCDSSGIASPSNDCLRVVLDSAKLFDTIPISQLTYLDHNLQHPHATFSGRSRVALSKFNAYLPAQEWQLDEGWIDMTFQFAGQPNDLIDPDVKTLRPSFSVQGQVQGASGRHKRSGLRFSQGAFAFTLEPEKLSLHNGQVLANDQQLSFKGPIYGLPALLFGKAARPFAKLQLTAASLQLDNLLDQSQASGSPIWGNTDFRLALDFDADHLAYLKLQIDQVRFRAEVNMPCSPGDTCIRIEQLQGLAYQQIPIRGRLALTAWPQPEADLQLQVTTPLAEVQPLLPMDKVKLQTGNLDLTLRYQGQLKDYADFNEAALRAKLRGRVKITDASADYLPKGYQFRHINTQLHFDEKDIHIDTLSGQLNGNTARAAGQITGLLPFFFDKAQPILKASLQLRSQKIDLNTFANEPLPGANTQAGSRSTRGTTFDRLIQRLRGDLKVQTDTLIYRSMRLSEVAFHSQLGADECGGTSTCIIVDSLRANLFGNTPIRATVKAEQLQDPFLTASVEVDMPIRELNRMFAPGQFKFKEGRLQLGFQYEGQPHRHFDWEEALLRAKIKGRGQLQQAAFTYQPKGYDFEQVQSAFSFNGEDLQFDTLDVRLNGNRLRGSGTIRDFLPFLFLPQQKLDASLRVHAARFDLNQFQAPEKFQTDLAKKAERPTIVTRLVNAGLNNINTDFDIQLDTVLYRSFTSYDVKGAVMLGEGRMEFKRTNMKLAGGQFILNGIVSGIRENQPDLDLSAQIQETDIRRFFQAFDNFGQQALTAQNLKGTLSGNLHFKGKANANYELAPDDMYGRFELQVKNGSLINLPALDSIRNLLFRNRDLSHIEFATLENTFYLNGQDLHIGHFHVPSSVLTFSVDGMYSLAIPTRTNLLFEIPMANLFRTELSRSALEKIESEEESGPSILIRARGGDKEELEFKWVLSRKE